MAFTDDNGCYGNRSLIYTENILYVNIQVSKTCFSDGKAKILTFREAVAIGILCGFGIVFFIITTSVLGWKRKKMIEQAELEAEEEKFENK